MLPRVDGLTVLRTLRASGKELPVIVLSALGEVDERIEGLRAGGDISWPSPSRFPNCSPGWRPCSAAAPARRARARPRRCGWAISKMNLLRRTVRRAGRDIELKPKAFALLQIPDAPRRPGW